MSKEKNYAKLNSECELEIHTDNGLFVNGNTHTYIGGRMYEISGEDLMKIYALLQDKQITSLHNVHENNSIYNYIIVGENAEKEELLKMYVELIDKINHINQTRHWWERKI